MDSVRKGLRANDLEKDNYGRLSCMDCGETLATEDDPDEVHDVRRCPGCGREWKEI